jgi:hypothetical protein
MTTIYVCVEDGDEDYPSTLHRAFTKESEAVAFMELWNEKEAGGHTISCVVPVVVDDTTQPNSRMVYFCSMDYDRPKPSHYERWFTDEYIPVEGAEGFHGISMGACAKSVSYESATKAEEMVREAYAKELAVLEELSAEAKRKVEAGVDIESESSYGMQKLMAKWLRLGNAPQDVHLPR